MRRSRTTSDRRELPRTLSRAIGVVSATVAYALSMHWVYESIIAPRFSYAGLNYVSPQAAPYLGAVLLAVALALFLPSRIQQPSDFIQWILFGTVEAPCIFVSQYNGVVSQATGLKIAVAVVGCALIIRFGCLISLPTLKFREQAFLPSLGRFIFPVCIVLSLLIYAALAQFVGLRFSYLSLTEVYDVRSDYVTARASFPLAGYLVPLQYSVINPLFITRGALDRRLGYLTFGIFGQVILYLTVGAKSVLFSIVGVAIILFAFRARKTVTNLKMIGAFTFFVLACTVVDVATSSASLTTLFTRRFLVVPGILVSAYVATFDNLPKTNFSEFLPTNNPYPGTTPGLIVGETFVRSSNTNANVAWLGHGYVSFGILGMVVETVVVLVLIRLADAASRGLRLSMSCALFFMPTIALASGSAFTAILTGGFAAGVVVAWRLPREEVAEPGKFSHQKKKSRTPTSSLHMDPPEPSPHRDLDEPQPRTAIGVARALRPER